MTEHLNTSQELQAIQDMEKRWLTELNFTNISFNAQGNLEDMTNQSNQLFSQNSFLLKNLENIHSYNSENMTMAIFFQSLYNSFIVAFYEDRIYALIPQTSCTRTAVAHAMEGYFDLGKNIKFRITTSTDSLREEAYTFVKQNPDKEFEYDSNRMHPQDYIALPLQGFFTNEGLHLMLK